MAPAPAPAPDFPRRGLGALAGLLAVFWLLLLAPAAHAAAFKTVPSPAGEGVTISYREPEPWACRTAFSTQRQITGWVNVPGARPARLFFWFVAAREAASADGPPTPFTVWLNGGPGTSSLLGLFTGVGPCSVSETGGGTFATSPREWGWDRASHMLFVDQPSRVGFSYDVPANGTLNLATGVVESPPVDRKGPLLVNGTFPSSDPGGMPSSSAIAADAVWHLLQAFFGIFPQYAPPSPPSPIGINLFAESYGGTYGPVFAASWRRRSARALAAGDESITPIVLSSLGLVNGCIDPLIEAPLYPIMASQNTYGIEALNPHDVRLALDSYHAEHGCVSLVERCRAAVARRDSASAEGTPPDPTVDAFIAKLCRLARARCVNGQQAPYLQAGRSAYDIAHPLRDPHPPQTYAEYLNTPALRDAIGGAPTNFSAANRAVTLAFARAADSYRRPLLPVLADLVRAGTRVALLHGDRDYICNWMGGDAVASAVAEAVGGAYASGYTAAGYAPVFVNSSYIGGVTRQFGNLSFTRVYQAGHMPALSQPETAFQIFVRIVLGTSLSTGQAVDLETYASPGDPANRGHSSQSLPAMPTPTCFVRSLNETCDGEQRRMALAGEGVTINGVLYEKSADWPLYDQVHTMSREGGGSGGPSRTRVVTETPAVAMTGVYVATALPVD